MNVLTRGSANEVALLVITTDLDRLRRCATSAAEIDASAEVSFRSSTQIYYGAHEILGLLTNMQRALFDRDDFIVLDDTLSLPPAATRFPAKDPSVHVTAFGVVTWHAADYSSTVSGTFTTYGLLMTDLETPRVEGKS
jgi:hypothetical protein